MRLARRRISAFLFMPRVVLLVLGTIVFLVVVVVGESAAYQAEGLHLNGEVMAFLLGFAIAAFLGGVWYVVSAFTGGTAAIVGATAERWTDKELALLGSGWWSRQGVTFDDGPRGSPWIVDVDHIVVGPSGVFVLESKYASSRIDLAARRPAPVLHEAVRQAQANAGRVAALLMRDAPGVPVQAVVVYWGWMVIAPADTVRVVDTVWVVAGKDATQWRSRFAAHQHLLLSPDTLAAVTRKLDVYVSTREQIDA